MIPLVPTLALAFMSFLCSMFVVLRIVIPVLPPSPFSNRVSPSEFGLPNFKTLSPADKSHLWLAAMDIAAVALFIWQAVEEATNAKLDYDVTTEAFGAGRMWLALTLRQTCLFIVAGLTLLHVRLGRPVTFGAMHWILAVPTAIMIITSTGVAATLAGANTPTLFIGLASYTGALGLFSSITFGCLIGTLLLIRRNLTRFNAASDSSPIESPFVEEKPRPSFATEEIEQLKDGASWITSVAGSKRDSIISAFSYSTRHTRKNSLTSSLRHQLVENSSRQIKPSFWFSGPDTAAIPPVPALPEPFRSRTPSAYLNDEVDPFARAPSPITIGQPQRQRPNGSTTSWLTSESGSQTTMTAWSYPATPRSAATPVMSNAVFLPKKPERDQQTKALHPSSAVSRPTTPVLSNTQILGGYGDARKSLAAEKANVSTSTAGSEVDVSIYRVIGWLVMIWVPCGLSFPYLLMTTASATSAPQWASILLVISVMISSPILACNVLFRSPLPIPSDLFDSYNEPPSIVNRAPSPVTTLNTLMEYKRSASVTAVESRRSGDVWLANGDAIDAKSKFHRARNMLGSKPKLSIIPVAPYKLDGELTPPIPIQGKSPVSPMSEGTTGDSFEANRKRKESKASSYYSGTTEAVQHASRVMIAQRHYSALATTVIIPPTPDQSGFSADSDDNAVKVATGIEEIPQRHGHLRARSVSSMTGPRSPITPPPSSPLPPTPPTLKNSRLAQLVHRRSQSSASVEFSFGAIADDNTREIDALSAGVLPILMPGIEVGSNVRITDFTPGAVSSGTTSKSKNRLSNLHQPSVSADFGSPVGTSTPKKVDASPRQRPTSSHSRQQLSLPSLGLGKEALTTLVSGVTRAFQGTQVSYSSVATEDGRRLAGHSNTVGHSPYAARSSMTAHIEHIPPPSAGSEVTLFDPEADAPQAQSTPQESRFARPRSSGPSPSAPSRRSSIQYIRADQVSKRESTRSASIISRSESDSENDAPGRQRSARAARPLRPKSNKLQVVQEGSASANAPVADGYTALPKSPSGLRQLSLLSERDLNVGASSPTSATQPLLLGKKKVARRGKAEVENKGLKPLNLSRTESTKERAHLRHVKVLPTVVIRPPSEHETSGYNL